MSWLSGYTYVKKGAVNATTAGAQTNYQLELIVGESSGAVGAGMHCNRHCQNFPNDIRFTKEDGITKHDYWVESITGTTPNRLVTVIIEVASIPASGAISFYLYYGAPGASSESSIADTFIREIDGAQPLIGAWNLDNNSSDKSGNDNDGTLNGGMGYGTGKIGQAAVFDGINDHINCGSNNCLNLTTGVTVEAWIKPGGNPSTAPIISKGCLWSAYALNVRNDLLQFQAYHLRYASYTFTTGVWYHVAGTFGDGYTKIYINGNLEYSKAETGPIGTVAEALFIGWDGDSAAPTPHYKGTVDEGKLYNRALTGDEISDIYGTGGDRYGYATTNYPGRVLICKYASPEPTWGSWGNEEIEDPIGVEPPYTAKLGGVSLWIPELSKQNFTITYEENDIHRFSFTLQNCSVNRTAITDHLTDDFVIHRGATAVFTGTINSDRIEYIGIDKIRIAGYVKSIKLGYEFYKHMLSTDAEAVGSVHVNNVVGPIGAVLFYSSSESQYFDQTTDANNSTTEDVSAMLWTLNNAILMGADATFTCLTIKYSAAAFYEAPSVIVIEYSTATGWSTLNCVDNSNNFTATPGTYNVLIENPPGDWVAKTVNGINKYWIRWRQTASPGEECSETYLDQIWGMGDGSLENKTTEANNVTINDIEVDFNTANHGIYIGHNEPFYTVKVQYSTKGVQSGTPTLKIEYSKGSDTWATLDCIDTSQFFTDDIGEHYLMIQNKHSDWAKDTVNSISKFWIRIVSVSGGYSTNPKLDRMWISQTDVCRVQFDNQYLDDMLDDVLIDTDYSFQKALVNSTFEAGVASWTGDMTQSSTEKHGGSYSVKLVAIGAKVYMLSELLPAAGVKAISFWTYLISLSTPGFRYTLHFYDRNRTFISGVEIMNLTGVETEWTEHEYTHDPSTFPAGTKYVRLNFDFENVTHNPVGTVYIDDIVLESTVPHIIVPGMRGEYYSKLQWVAGLANAATWEDGNGNKQNYLWWIDSDDLVHIAQSTSIAFNDITSSLSVLTNKLSYFDMGNRLYSLGSGDGINQTRAAVEDITAQTANGLREALVTDARILEYEALKEFAQKALSVSNAATKVITLNMSTYDWFEGGYAISDTIKLRQPIWGIPDETTYRIIRADIGKDMVAIDVGDPRQHLDTIQADLKAQIDVSDVYMAGATNIYAQSVQGNMERTATNAYPLILKIRIPDDAVKINKVLLDWNLSGFRTYTSVVENGGSCSPTSAAGGADVVTSAAHNLGTRSMNSVSGGGITTVADDVESDAPTQTGDYRFVATAYTLADLRGFEEVYDCAGDVYACIGTALITNGAFGYLSNDDHTQNVGICALDGSCDLGHAHTVVAYGNHTHTVNIADHTHAVTIPGHAHPLTSGIIQESLGSPTLELYVNSVLVDNAYTGDNTDINIAGYMNTGAWNEIKLQPKEGTVALLRAELNAFVKIFIRSR